MRHAPFVGAKGETMICRTLALAGLVGLMVAVGGGVALAQQPSDRLADSDRKFLMEAAEGGQMEVDLGELARQKAANDAVRQFAQRMAADHTKANQELAQLSASKGVELASRPSAKAQSTKDRLSKLSGAAFDREYVKLMVRDHETDVSAFRQESRSAKDPDVKAWATKTLPVLEDHLKAIRQIQPQVARQ
jgi:putative membrane protein